MMLGWLVAAMAAVQGTAPPAEVLARAIADGIEDGVFPGAVVMVGNGERILLARGYGHLTWSAETPRPDPRETLYDLASLTKVVATTPAVMLLVDEGRLQVDRPVQAYLPEFVGDGKARVTVRHLLEHRSGLRAFLPLHELADSRGEARRLVLEEPLRWPPGGRVVYSDLNAMLLGWIVERVAGEPLDRFVEERLFRRVAMSQTRFRPPRAWRGRIAPVGRWRGLPVAGELHDQNAVRLGGVSGHAGLYSTGLDLARYAQLWLNEGRVADDTLLAAATVRSFRARAAGHRALGWAVRDTTTTDDAGIELSAAAFGHGGFTGASLWIDPERDVFVVILTNRVFAPRTRNSITKLKGIRARVADAAVALRAARCDVVVPAC